MKCVAFGVTLVALAGGVAAAEEPTIESFNPEAAVAPTSVVEGAGVKVGAGTVLHPTVGIETGVVSNVFYEESSTEAAGLLRVIAQIGTGSLSDQRLARTSTTEDDQVDQGDTDLGSLRYRASLRLSYDALLSGNETVRDTGGLGIGASLHGIANPQGRVAFGFDDDFERVIRATNFETSVNTNRDLNNLRLAVLYQPRDRSVNGSIYYTNMLDVFERSTQQFADRMDNRFGLRLTWKLFPKTQFYGDASIGYIFGLDSSSMKSSSMPLVAKAGAATLLSVRTTLNLEAGYTNGFYSSGPNYSAPLVNAQLAFRYAPTGRIGIVYGYQHQDSINANYFRDHLIRLWIRHGIAPFMLMVEPELHLRQYNGITLVAGPPTRDDVIMAVTGGVSYIFRDWIAATLNYRFSTVQTDYIYMSDGVTDDPTYVRHELLAGVRVAL